MAFYTNQNVFLFLNGNLILMMDKNSIKTDSDNAKQRRIMRFPNLTDPVDDTEENTTKPASKSNMTSAAISKCSTFIAIGDANNSLHLWKNTNSDDPVSGWTLSSVRPLVRKCHKIIFTNSGSDIIVADRSGDVFTFSAGNSDPGKFLLGHICLILDMAISNEDSYLATCDKDGKIRVSSYPNAYNIVSYCLGHQEFVSAIQFLPNDGALLSSSGDGTVKIWDFKNGSLKSSVTFHEDISFPTKDNEICEFPMDNLLLSEKQVMFSVRNVRYYAAHGIIVVLFHLKSGIAIYQLSNDQNGCVFKQLITLEAPPLDAIFTATGELYVLTREQAIVHFEFNVSSAKFSETILNNQDGVSTLRVIKIFFKNHDQIPFQDDFVTLFKRAYFDVPEEEDCSESTEKKNKLE